MRFPSPKVIFVIAIAVAIAVAVFAYLANSGAEQFPDIKPGRAKQVAADDYFAHKLAVGVSRDAVIGELGPPSSSRPATSGTLREIGFLRNPEYAVRDFTDSWSGKAMTASQRALTANVLLTREDISTDASGTIDEWYLSADDEPHDWSLAIWSDRSGRVWSAGLGTPF